MSQHFERELNAFRSAKDQRPGMTYPEWQPTKWQALSLLRESLGKATQARAHPVATALELGCGSATLLLQLASDGVRCVGVDEDASALQLAREAASILPIRPQPFLRLQEADFLDHSVDLQPADLVMSIGVVEHFEEDKQQLMTIARHCELSKRWVLIGIPNQTSPLFRCYLQAMEEDGTLYDDQHWEIDIPSIVRRLGHEIVIEDGCHLFRDRLVESSARYSSFPDIDMTSADIEALAHVERATPIEVRLRFGFLRWYLIDVAAPDLSGEH
jgi:SAM-dependent methyltransferase